MTEPKWLAHGRTLKGTREYPGAANNPKIMGMANRSKRWLGFNYTADAVPWCGLFIADCMEAAGLAPPSGFVGVRALAWASWGVDAGMVATRPPLGAVAVMGRKGGGHVTLVAGVYDNGDILGLGGNQGDMVKESRFARDRITAFRWPKGIPFGSPAPWVDGVGEIGGRED